MSTIATRPCLISAWLPAPQEIKSAINVGAHRIVAATKRLEARWQASAREAVAMRELGSLSDRDLQDIGLNRGDILRIALEARAAR